MDKVLNLSGKKVKTTNLEKVFWPKGRGPDGKETTKGDLIKYYRKISPALLPYLKDRPVNMRRYPDGITGEMFYQQDAPDPHPDWIVAKKLYAPSVKKYVDHIICNDEATLIYLVNLGCIDIYPWFSTWQRPNNPLEMVFDLDPLDENAFKKVLQVALIIKEILDDLKIIAYVKTSGSKGIHILVPLIGNDSYPLVRKFANAVAKKAMQKSPELIISNPRLTKRQDRVLIDASQNARGKTLASVFSVRPKPSAPVSVPVDWREVEKGFEIDDFNIQSVLKNSTKRNLLFERLLKKPRYNLRDVNI